MKKSLLVILLNCIFSISMFSQETITIFYDKFGQETSNKNNATFYRKLVSVSENLWSVKEYFLTDTLRMTGTFNSRKMNIKTGEFVYYYSTGKKTYEGSYSDNKLVGLWVLWHENGQKKSEGNFKFNSKIGLWKYWDENGTLISVEDHFNPSEFSIEGFYENGTSKYKGYYRDNKAHGLWIYTNNKGRITLSGNCKNGKKEGLWTRYFLEGSQQLIFKNDESNRQQLGGLVKGE